MLFQIRHVTRFKYEQPAYESHNELRMRPREGLHHRCISFGLEIDPPGAILEYQDFYGNSVHALSVYPPHSALAIAAQSLVERSPELDAAAVAMTFREFLARDLSRNRLEYDFLNPSIYIPFSDPLRKFFWMVHPANDEDVFEYVQRVVGFVHGQFEYEPGLTQVHSTADGILAIGRGVCQDFAHLAIGVLRLAGVPARYVSGYLAPTSKSAPPTRAAPSASHAWLEAQVPLLGWVGFDPRHGCRTDFRHIRVAIGRDYADVPPIKDVFRTAGGEQKMTVELDVEPIDSAQTDAGQSQSQH